MNPPGPPATPLSRARERYQKRRRRQLATMAAAGVIAIGLILVVVVIALLVRGCRSVFISTAPVVPREANDPRWAHELTALEQRNAPWLFEFDGDRLYLASDRQRRDVTYPTWPIDTLSALAVADGSQLWEQAVDTEFAVFYCGGDYLAGFRNYLAGPPRLFLACYTADSGALAWTLELDYATKGCITAEDNIVVLGYELPDGYRLAAYNLAAQVQGDAATEAKAWGMRLPLDGLLVQDLSSEYGGELKIASRSGLIVYRFHNVIGLVDMETGARLKEYAAPGFIHDYALDVANDTCYLLVSGNAEGTFLLQSIPIHNGRPHNLPRFQGRGEYGRLLAGNGALMLCYPTTDAGRNMKTKIICYRDNTQLVEQEVDGAVGSTLHPLAAPDEFLVSLSAGLDEYGAPVGGGQLLSVPAVPGGEIAQVARFRQPVQGLATLKDDCLVLLKGGEIYSYMAEYRAHHRLRKAKYPVLIAVTSPDDRRLAVFATTEKFMDDQPGQPLQVIIFE
ncbi:hypothetical protein JW859_00730 [bacterium]|nr:hypothetical protein [bacterium]